MEQSGTNQERRPWAGEDLWAGSSTTRRTVEVTPAGDGRYQAVGQANQKPAFDVLLREEQLFRFRRRMERAGAVVQGVPAWTEPGSDGESPRRPSRPPGRPPIGDQGDDPPPPTQPKMLVADPNPLLLLADPVERRPVLPPGMLGLTALGQVPDLEVRLPRPDNLGDPGGNPNDLARQRWSVIAPKGPVGDALLEAISPLIKLREEQQGAPVVPYRVGTTEGIAAANEWVRTTYLNERVAEEERPRYLLILGDLGDVSAELQQRLAASAYVGRLCFDDVTGYQKYVDKLVRQEKNPPKQDARSLFFATHDGSSATSIGYDSLITPALEMCDAVPRRDFPVREVLEVGSPDDWSAQRLLETVRDNGPSVLFTLSHGLGTPTTWSHAQRRQMQGAMMFGQQEPLTADKLATGSFLPNGAWFFLACLGAGTPSRSVYRPWLERLKAEGQYEGRVENVLSALPGPGEQPFIAALPRAALSNPDGPLVFIGHLDLAWTYAFRDAYGARRPRRFVEVVKQIWAGRRAGVAMKALLRFASEVESELLGMVQADAELVPGQPPPPEVVDRGNLYMERLDLGGYLLLGDPAVRVAPARD